MIYLEVGREGGQGAARARHRQPSDRTTVALQCCYSVIAVVVQCCHSGLTALFSVVIVHRRKPSDTSHNKIYNLNSKRTWT
jgi:hypothetical protein